MAISQYDYVPENKIIDTYVPLPFKEMQEAAQRKQLERDTVETGIAKIPTYLKLELDPEYYNSTGTRKRQNASYAKYQQDTAKFGSEIEEASKLLEQGDVKGAKIKTREIASKVNNWRNTFGIQAENETKQYRTVRENIQKDKDYNRDNFRAIEFDLAIDGQAGRDLSQNYQTTNFNSQSSFIDLPTEIANVTSKVKLSTEEKKSVSEGLRKGFTTKEIFESNIGNNLNEVYQAAKPIIERATPYIQQKLVSSVANNPEHVEAMTAKKLNPYNSNHILAYMDSIPTEKTKKITKNGKQVEVKEKSTAYQDYMNTEQSKLFAYASAFAEYKDVIKSDWDYNPGFTQSDESLGKANPYEALPFNLQENGGVNSAANAKPSNLDIANYNFVEAVKNIWNAPKNQTGNIIVDGIQKPWGIIKAINKFTDDIVVGEKDNIVTDKNRDFYNNTLKSGILENIKDPMKRAMAEKRLDAGFKKAKKEGQTMEDYGKEITTSFDKGWNNIIADIAVTKKFGDDNGAYATSLAKEVIKNKDLGYQITDKEGTVVTLPADAVISNGSALVYGNDNTGKIVFSTNDNKPYSIDISSNSQASRGITERNDILINSYKNPIPINNIMYGIVKGKINQGMIMYENTPNQKKIDLSDAQNWGKLTVEVVADGNATLGKKVILKYDGKDIRTNGDADELEFAQEDIDESTVAIIANGLGLSGTKQVPFKKGKEPIVD